MRRRPLRPRRTRLRLLRRRPPRTRIVPRARTRLGLRWVRLRRRRRRRGRRERGGPPVRRPPPRPTPPPPPPPPLPPPLPPPWQPTRLREGIVPPTQARQPPRWVPRTQLSPRRQLLLPQNPRPRTRVQPRAP